MKYAIAWLALGAGLLAGAMSPAWADVEGVTVGLMASTPGQQALAQRLSRSLDHAGGLRILPIAGKGAVQTLTDLIELRGVDAALIPSDTLAFMQRNGLVKDGDKKLAFILRLSALDVHVIARKETATLADLGSKTVAIGSVASEAYVAGQSLFAATGLAARTIEADGDEAVRAVLDGKADAAVLVGVAPLPELKLLSAETGLHLLDIGLPADLQDTYAPSLIRQEVYPQLIGSAKPVETISTSLVIAASNWKRGTPQYTKLKLFGEELFTALQPGDESDANINLAASVPGWARHPAADAALGTHAEKTLTSTQTAPEN